MHMCICVHFFDIAMDFSINFLIRFRPPTITSYHQQPQPISREQPNRNEIVIVVCCISNSPIKAFLFLSLSLSLSPSLSLCLSLSFSLSLCVCVNQIRGISITSIAARLFERIVHRKWISQNILLRSDHLQFAYKS